MNGKRHAATAVAMVTGVLFSADESRVQIRAGAEHPAVARHHDAFHPVVDVEELESMLHLAHDGIGEGIVFLRAIELKDHNRGDFLGRCRDVMEANLFEGGGRVRRGEGELGDVGSHDGHDMVTRKRQRGRTTTADTMDIIFTWQVGLMTANFGGLPTASYARGVMSEVEDRGP